MMLAYSVLMWTSPSGSSTSKVDIAGGSAGPARETWIRCPVLVLAAASVLASAVTQQDDESSSTLVLAYGSSNTHGG